MIPGIHCCLPDTATDCHRRFFSFIVRSDDVSQDADRHFSNYNFNHSPGIKCNINCLTAAQIIHFDSVCIFCCPVPVCSFQ